MDLFRAIIVLAALYLMGLFIFAFVHMAYCYPRAGRIIIKTGYWPSGWRMLRQVRFSPQYRDIVWQRIPENLSAEPLEGRYLIFLGWLARFFVFAGVCAATVEFIHWLRTGESSMFPLMFL